MQQMRQNLSREQQAKEKLSREEKRALELIERLNKADTPFAKEKIIRDELQMQRPGETVLQIPHPSP
jgi:cell division protein FtsB